MTKSRRFHTRLAVCGLFIFGALTLAQEGGTKKLPAPQTDGGKPLMQALKERRSTRAFSDKELSGQVLSNLLWAAAGVNRPADGKRTAPSAHNKQEVDLYVFTPDGVYLFDPKAHALTQVLGKDSRAQIGGQGFVKTAPLNLVYVADYARMAKASEADKNLYAAADTGFISQNVYLFCASEGFGTVVYAGADRARLRKTLKLRPEQKIILSQCVGYPKAEVPMTRKAP